MLGQMMGQCKLNSMTPSEVQELLRYLTPDELDEINNLLATDKAIWRPLPGPQSEAFHSPADELFYGGAAGGGKSDLLIGLGLTAHQKSIIFRREYPQLKDIVERARMLIGQQGRYNGQQNMFRLRDGRVLEFGAVQHEGDQSKYQGRAHDLKAFDELPNFLESQYRFLIGWNRTTVANQRTRVVSAGNPPTSGDGEWVIRRWGAWLDPQHPNPAKDGELRWFAVIGGNDTEVEDCEPFEHNGETIRPRSRTFIPARLGDNPYLASTDYMATVQAMPEPLRSQMLNGDFRIGLEDDQWQVIPTAWVLAAQERWKQRSKPELGMTTMGVDVARGGKDKTVIARRYGNWFAELEKHPGKSTPDGQAVAMLVKMAIEGHPAINIDVIGVGSSVYDQLKYIEGVNGINFAEGSYMTDKSGRLNFANMRAQAYWKFREALDPKTGDDVALPPDPELRADLCAAKWSVSMRGILVESKEDIVKRLRRSPDCADAVVLAGMDYRASYTGTVWGNN